MQDYYKLFIDTAFRNTREIFEYGKWQTKLYRPRKFDLRLGEFAREIGVDVSDLIVDYGNFSELEEGGLKKEKLTHLTHPEKVFGSEELLVISLKGSEPEPILVLRGLPYVGESVLRHVEGEANERKQLSIDVSKRYISFSPDDKIEDFSLNFFYYLRITLARFIALDRHFYGKNIAEIQDPDPDEQGYVLEEAVRKGLDLMSDPIGKDADDEKIWKLPDDVHKSRKLATRFLTDILFIRVFPERIHTPEEIIQKIFDEIENFDASEPYDFEKKITYTTPNQILEKLLTMSVLSYTCILNDYYRTKSDTPELYTKRIGKFSDIAGRVYLDLNSSLYDPQKSDERHKLCAEEAQAFRDMYAEISSEISKIPAMCEITNLPRRAKSANEQMLGKRISKIKPSEGQLLVMQNEVVKIATPDSKLMIHLEDFFSTARAFVTVSARDDDGKLIREIGRKMDRLQHVIKRNAAHTFNANDTKDPYLDTDSPERNKALAVVLTKVADFVPRHARSKRCDDFHFKEVMDLVREYNNTVRFAVANECDISRKPPSFTGRVEREKQMKEFRQEHFGDIQLT